MIIIYTPEDGEPEQQFNVRSVLTSEAQVVARTTDLKWGEVKLGVRDEEPAALRGVVWILLKRETPTLRWGDFDPPVDSMRSRFDEREVRLYAADIVALPAEQQRAAIVELRAYAADPACVDLAIKEAAEPPKDETAETSPSDG